MSRLLFADYVRRRAWILASLGTITAIGWYLAVTWSPAFVQAAMAGSILVASTFTMFGAKDVAPMEVQILPVSRRQIARTIWFVSTVVPVGVMTTGKVLGWTLGLLSRPVYASPDAIWLSAAMDFVSAGTMLCTVPLVQRVSLSIKHPRLQAAAVLGIMLPVMTLPYVPFVIRKQLPIAWSEVTPLIAALVAVGAVCTALAYLVSPPLVIGNRRALANAMASHSRSGFWIRLEHLTGLKRLMFQAWRSAAISQVLTPVLIAGAVYSLASVFDSGSNPWSGGWLAALRDFGFLPFEADWQPSSILMLFMLGSFGFRVEPGIQGTGVLTSMRHLRTLPLDTRQLNAMLIGLVLLVWVNGWVVLAGFHWLVNQEPLASLRLAEFFGLFGLDCVNKAAQLRYGTKGLINFPAFVVIGAVLLGTVRMGVPLQPGLLILGAAGLVTAWLLNRHTLTTRRTIYAPQKYRPFGVEIPGQS